MKLILSFFTSHFVSSFHLVIRRKSASERLAESKSSYLLRTPLLASPSSATSSQSSQTITKSAAKVLYHKKLNTSDNSIDGMDAVDQVSKKTITNQEMVVADQNNSQTSISSSSNRKDDLTMKIDQSQKLIKTEESDSLVTKINNNLQKIRSFSSQQNNFIKKRISPKLSDTSVTNVSSDFEVKLRELISLDSRDSDQDQALLIREESIRQNFDDSDDAVIENHQIDSDRKDIYRAELKYIGSSTSSSMSSIYSETYNISCSPDKTKPYDYPSLLERFQDYSINETKSKSSSIRHGEENNNSRSEIHSNPNTVIRSKSDVNRYREKSKSQNDMNRFLLSLCLDSDQTKSLDKKNDEDSITLSSPSSSASIENVARNRFEKESDCLYSLTKSSTNEFQSLSISSETTTTNDSVGNKIPSMKRCKRNAKNRTRNHSGDGDNNVGGALKLTFENLMLHQQSLASSRSCNNLMIFNHNLHNHQGSSIVERNARIIKWLFNCRKSMDNYQN